MQQDTIDFRLSNPENPFAQEIYCQYFGTMIPLHPYHFSSKNRIQLNSLPKAKEWESIFHMFPFHNVLEYATYFDKIYHHLSENKQEEIIIGYGFQLGMKKKSELLRLVKLPHPLQRLFLERGILPRSLFLLESFEHNILENLVGHLLQPYLKNNIIKEIVELFADLTCDKQKIYLQEILQAKEKISRDGLTFLNDRFRKILYDLRYPARAKIKNRVDTLLKSVEIRNKNIKIYYDDTFERDFLNLEICIRSDKDIKNLSNLTKNHDIAETLKKALEILKNPT